jgi:uroporphyrinogen-III synthase
MMLPLSGRRVALAEGRQLEELAEMLRKEGAMPLRYPMVSIIDAPGSAPVVAWLHELISGKLDWVILLTGEGLRRLVAVADREGLRERMIDALGRTKIMTRGPKPVRALKEIGLGPTRIAEAPTTEGVIASLRHEALTGTRVGVQLYGEPNPPLEQFLSSAGAVVRTVVPYLYAPAVDADRVVELIEALFGGTIDVLVFTSSPQVERLYEVARQCGLEAKLNEGLTRTKVAAVGPVVTETLSAKGARVDICPEQGFVMKNLVQLIKRVVGGATAS